MGTNDALRIVKYYGTIIGKAVKVVFMRPLREEIIKFIGIYKIN